MALGKRGVAPGLMKLSGASAQLRPLPQHSRCPHSVCLPVLKETNKQRIVFRDTRPGRKLQALTFGLDHGRALSPSYTEVGRDELLSAPQGKREGDPLHCEDNGQCITRE